MGSFFKKLPLKWNIFVYLLAFCALLIAILWFFQTVFLGDMYKMIRHGEMEKAITLVEQNIDNPSLPSVIAGLAQNQEIFVTADSIMIPLYDNQFIFRHVQPSFKPQREQLTETREFLMENGSIVTFTFNAIISPVNATVTTIKTQLYIVTAVMLILSLILALLIARKISKPLEDLNEGAKVLSDGNYDITFGGHGFLEISELSQTLNAAASELSKTEHLRRELIANVSHDLRTPLSLIYGYAEMMHDFPGEVRKENMEVLMAETTRLSTLVSDMLDISKFESGAERLKAKTYNLTASILSLCERMNALLKKEGYSIEFIHDGELFASADETKISQAFYNLLINAVNYSGANKHVVVTQKREEGFVKISVKDSGEGIKEESLPYIWDRYYKLDGSHKRPVTGTGLGLSIVKKIMTLHGGECGVYSKENEGSTFFIKLRLDESERKGSEQ